MNWHDIIGISTSVIILFLILGAYLYYRVTLTRKYWKMVSKRFDLHLEQERPFLSMGTDDGPIAAGKYLGHDLRCDTLILGSTEMNTYTRCRIKLKQNVDHRLRIYKATWTARLERALGAQDIKMGHPKFDKEYIVQSDNEAFAKKVVTTEIQQALLLKNPDKGFYWLDDNRLKFEVPYNDLKSIKEYTDFVNAIDICVMLSEELGKLEE